MHQPVSVNSVANAIQQHDQQDSITHCTTSYHIHLPEHQNSYFSRTISDWNKLPVHVIEVTDTDTFKTELQSLF